MRYRDSQGLGLIELTIIVTIIGILAAIVISRLVFTDYGAYTRLLAHTRAAFLGGIRAANQQWRVNGQPQRIILDGSPLSMTNTGFPENRGDILPDGVLTEEKCLAVWQGVMQNPPTIGTNCPVDCEYHIELYANPSTGRNECLYVNNKIPRDNVIYYDPATGFVR